MIHCKDLYRSYSEGAASIFKIAGNDIYQAALMAASFLDSVHHWQQNRLTIVSDILLASAFQNCKFTRSHFFPQVVEFSNTQMPFPSSGWWISKQIPFNKDRHWQIYRTFGNKLGEVCSEVRYVLCTVATHVQPRCTWSAKQDELYSGTSCHICIIQ